MEPSFVRTARADSASTGTIFAADFSLVKRHAIDDVGMRPILADMREELQRLAQAAGPR
jgi:hypothetical protein